MSRPLTVAAVLAWVLLGCETYDPPPTATLQIPEGGLWYPETPLTLDFTEAIDPDSLRVSLWSRELDEEGNLTVDAEAIATECTLAGGDACGLVSLELSQDRRQALLHQGGAFAGREGRPHILVVHEGLADAQGNTRQVDDWFDFQITPNCQGGNPIDLPLQHSAMLLIGDLKGLVPGVYLRIYFEMEVDPANGQTWLIGTLADILPGEAPNATDPASLAPKLESTGWMISLDAWMDTTPDGDLCMRTVEQDLQLRVLGLFDVILGDFRIEATFVPGAGAIPDTMDGFMTSGHGQWGIEGGDLNDLGQVGASVVATGVDPATLEPPLGSACDEDPCAEMSAAGGICYVPTPWTVPESCP